MILFIWRLISVTTEMSEYSSDNTATYRFRRGCVLASGTVDWLPLVVLTCSCIIAGHSLSPWMFSWSLAASIFFGFKWLTWRRARRNGATPSITRSLGYWFACADMNAAVFLSNKAPRKN